MAEIVFNTPHWKTQATELFRNEYEDTKDGTKKFHEQYSAASDLYWTLAQRVVAHEFETDDSIPTEAEPGIVAYRWMYDAYRGDVRTQTYDQLDDLIDNYNQVKHTEGR